MAHLVVIDDQLDMCGLIGSLAGDLGFDVTPTRSFREFEAVLGSKPIDVIMLDLQMPDKDGIEYLRFLGHTNCQASIVLMSGFDKRVLQTAMRLGESLGLDVIKTLSKPFDLDELSLALQQIGPGSYRIDQSDIIRGLKQSEFAVHYQPKVWLNGLPESSSQPRLRTELGWRTLESCEALLRWTHKEMGPLSPSVFIAVAEECGEISRLTEFVIDQVVRTMADWSESGWQIPVAINFSPSLMFNLGIPDRLARLAQEYSIPPSNIILEITETAAMSDPVVSMDILSRIRLKGFRLAMDDFGTGYSSLLQLHRMPFNELKIDMSLVKELEDKDAQVIVRAIVDLAHTLGLRTCAEGVETEAAERILTEMGCETAQGWLYSKAMPAELLPGRLKAPAYSSELTHG